MGRLRSPLLAAIALVASACASYGVDTAPDPVSTAELTGVGGATYLDLTSEEIRGRAGLVLDATVIDVRRSRLNTDDGAFPPAEVLEERGVTSLDVVTDVVVGVVDVLDARRGVVGVPSPGDRFTITVGGGRFVTRLGVARARALGMTDSSVIVPTTVEPVVCPEHEPHCGPPQIEVETPVTAPVDFVYGSSPGERLTEGERVVVFLERVPLRRYGGGTFEAWVPVHPAGILRPTEDGRWEARGTGETYAPGDLTLLRR